MTNVLGYGDMEYDDGPIEVLRQWMSRCDLSVSSNVKHQGSSSLFMNVTLNGKALINPKSCYVFRPVAPACRPGRVLHPLTPGDVIIVSFKVRLSQPGRVFQVYTSHYHEDKGTRKWGLPPDDSHVVSRTLIADANTWYNVEAVHEIGPDWTFIIDNKPKILIPKKCNHYHLRFRAPGSDAAFWLDDVKIAKVARAGSSSEERAKAIVSVLFLYVISPAVYHLTLPSRNTVAGRAPAGFLFESSLQARPQLLEGLWHLGVRCP